jgi:23S rRNA pseudouridine1911/1915/1917 synthase
LNAIGHPIVGDALYGGTHRRVPHQLHAVQRLTRPFLHAERIGFHHPRSGERLEFTAPLPQDLRDVLDDIDSRLLHALENTEPIDESQQSDA